LTALVFESNAMTIGLLIVGAAHTLFHGFGGASVGYEVDVEYRVPAISVLAGYTVFLVGGLCLWWCGVTDAPPYLVAFGAGLAVQNTVLFLCARNHMQIAGSASPEVVRQLVREALPLGISAAATAIYFYTDTILLRPLRGDEDVARYQVAYKLMSFGVMAPIVFSQVLFPVFVRCHGASRETLRKVVRRTTFYLCLVGVVASTILYCLAGDLLAFVFGENYRSSSGTMRILSVAMLLICLAYPHTIGLIATGRAKVFTRITLLSAALNVGLNLLVLKRYGPEGAAATTLVTELCVLIMAVVLLSRHERVHGLSMKLVGPLLLGAALTLLLLGPLKGVSLAISLPAAIVVSLIGCVVLRAFPFQLGVEEELDVHAG